MSTLTTLVSVLSISAYLVVALSARTRAGRDRAPTVRTATGVARWSPLLLWVPYVIIATRPGPEAALPDAVRALGLVLVVIGPALMIWSAYALGPHFDVELQVRAGHEVVRTGPYGVVRHPIYSGVALHLIGACIATGNLVLVVSTLGLAFPAIYQRATVEERLLREELGDAYVRYAREVPMLIPLGRHLA